MFACWMNFNFQDVNNDISKDMSIKMVAEEITGGEGDREWVVTCNEQTSNLGMDIAL